MNQLTTDERHATINALHLAHETYGQDARTAHHAGQERVALQFEIQAKQVSEIIVKLENQT